MIELRQKFDPLDLEIIEQVYGVACAYIEAKNLYANANRTPGEEDALRKSIFALAATSPVDFDSLCDKVMSVMAVEDQSRHWDEPPAVPLTAVSKAA